LVWKLEMLKILKLKLLKLKFKIFGKTITKIIWGKNFLIKELNKLKLKFKIKTKWDKLKFKNIKTKSRLKIFPL